MTVQDVAFLVFVTGVSCGMCFGLLGYELGYAHAKAKLTQQAMEKMEAIVAALKAHGES